MTYIAWNQKRLSDGRFLLSTPIIFDAKTINEAKHKAWAIYNKDAIIRIRPAFDSAIPAIIKEMIKNQTPKEAIIEDAAHA